MKANARGVINTDVDELPTNAMMALDCARIASGDPMSHGTDASELFDVDVDQFARTFPLIATHRFSRLED